MVIKKLSLPYLSFPSCLKVACNKVGKIKVHLKGNITVIYSRCMILKFLFCIIGGKREGEIGQGFDVYLLDNRNRTQKWDE